MRYPGIPPVENCKYVLFNDLWLGLCFLFILPEIWFVYQNDLHATVFAHYQPRGNMKSQFWWLVFTSLLVGRWVGYISVYIYLQGAVIAVVAQEFLFRICGSKYLDPPRSDTSLKIQKFL